MKRTALTVFLVIFLMLPTFVGAAAGVAGGYIYDQHEKSKEAAYRDGYNAGQQTPK